MPQINPTNINAHKARRDELRAEAHKLNGEADQLDEYIRALEGEPQDKGDQEVSADSAEMKPEARSDAKQDELPEEDKPNAPGKAQTPEEKKVPNTTAKAENLKPAKGGK